MKEIRIHGRGGQGVVLGEQILVAAFTAQGKYASGFPMFGFERRGAPVISFVRIDDKPVREKTQIYSPDCLIILDRSLTASTVTFSGIKPGGILVLDSPTMIKAKLHENVEIAGVVDATSIALSELGIPINNSAMLGAFAATTNWVTLDSIVWGLERYFTGKDLERNETSARRAFRETKVVRW